MKMIPLVFLWSTVWSSDCLGRPIDT